MKFSGHRARANLAEPTRKLSEIIKEMALRRTGGGVDDLGSEWQCKGATLSDKTARKEFGLPVQAIRARKLQYRHTSIYGNPFLRLLRREVEALVKQKHGRDYLKTQRAKTELAQITSELRRLKVQVAALERRKSQLIAGLET